MGLGRFARRAEVRLDVVVPAVVAHDLVEPGRGLRDRHTACERGA